MNLELIAEKSSWTPAKPKYLQLAELITSEIEKGALQLNQQLPSVNKMSKTLEVSRETVFKALNHLSERGIIKSANRQGYYVTKTNVRNRLRVFFLLDKFTTFKEDLYHSFKETIGDAGEVDLFFHHHNLAVFRSLIIDNLPHYTHFVITSYMKKNVKKYINMIPAEKRIIIDSYAPKLKGKYSMIYQDFARDIQMALEKASDKLNKYNRLILLAPGSLYHASWVIKGFEEYSKSSGFETQVLPKVNADDFQKGDVYITLSGYDRELVEVIKISHSKKYKIGKDIGIISYNDTPVKEVLEGGITVICTDFRQMGQTAAQLILNQETKTIANPTQIILRKSL